MEYKQRDSKGATAFAPNEKKKKNSQIPKCICCYRENPEIHVLCEFDKNFTKLYVKYISASLEPQTNSFLVLKVP